MADKKVSEFGTPSGGVASTDKLYLIDVSDTTDHADGSGRADTMANVVTKGHGLSDGSRVVVSGGIMASNSTDLPVADGGTGASDASGARTNLGLVIGTHVQAQGATLDTLEALSLVQGDVLYATAADTLTRLAKGTASQQLRMNAGATAPEWATIVSGGQTLVTHIVAASGGTHTTLGAALAAAGNGDTIWVREGTYSESAISSSLTDITILGENPESAIIDVQGNNCTLSGARVNIRGVRFNSSGGIITVSGVDAGVLGNTFVGSGTATLVAFASLNGRFQGNRVEQTSGSASNRALSVEANYVLVNGNNFEVAVGNGNSTLGTINIDSMNWVQFCNNSILIKGGTAEAPIIRVNGALQPVITGNVIDGNSLERHIMVTGGADAMISGNVMRSGRVGVYVDTGSWAIVTGNYLHIDSTSGTRYGVYIGGSETVVSGNYIRTETAATSYGVRIITGMDNCVITGNIFNRATTGVDIQANTCENNVVTNNNFVACTNTIVDVGLTTSIRDNVGVPVTLEKTYLLMKNTSGSSVAAGDVVTLKAVAAGDEFTTTTAASDSQVLGMSTATIANNAYGYIQTLGKTILLKVNGTADIAIGDFLTTYTTAGIAKKAAAATLGVTLGDLAFAIALEAYTTDDSSGVIDALLIHPRRL